MFWWWVRLVMRRNIGDEAPEPGIYAFGGRPLLPRLSSRMVTKQRFWLVCKVLFWLGIAFAIAKPHEGTCAAGRYYFSKYISFISIVSERLILIQPYKVSASIFRTPRYLSSTETQLPYMVSGGGKL